MSEFSTAPTPTWTQLAKQAIRHLAAVMESKTTPWRGYASQPFRLGPAAAVWPWARPARAAGVSLYEILRSCATVWAAEDARACCHPETPPSEDMRLWLAVWASWRLMRPSQDGGCQMPPEAVREILPELRLAAARVAQMVEEAERLAETQDRAPLPIDSAPPRPTGPRQGLADVMAPAAALSLSWPPTTPAAPPFPSPPA